MNDSNKSSNGLLVLRFKEDLSCETIQAMTDLITPTADQLGVEPLVLGSGADARLEYGSSGLLERICVALEEIAAQGRAPEVNVAENAPQALNARPSSLNSRDRYYGQNGNGYQPNASACSDPLRVPMPPKER